MSDASEEQVLLVPHIKFPVLGLNETFLLSSTRQPSTKKLVFSKRGTQWNSDIVDSLVDTLAF